MTNLDLNSSTWSSVRLGRWAMSMAVPFRAARYLTVTTSADGCLPAGATARRRVRRASRVLLGVELDDELLLDREGVNENTHLVGDYLEPCGRGALAGLGPGHHERGHLVRLRPHLDDVVLAHPVGGDVDLAPVDQDVPVPDELARHVTALREPGPVDHVVETALQDLEQHLAGLAALAGRFLVVVVELAFKDAVDPLGLLLLPDLEQELALLRPVPAVLARGIGPDLNRALRRIALRALQEQLHLLAAAALAVRTGVSSHSVATPQTRRRFGGRQPLCGTGVTS